MYVFRVIPIGRTAKNATANATAVATANASVHGIVTATTIATLTVPAWTIYGSTMTAAAG